jgi:hypothetical protein
MDAAKTVLSLYLLFAAMVLCISVYLFWQLMSPAFRSPRLISSPGCDRVYQDL